MGHFGGSLTDNRKRTATFWLELLGVLLCLGMLCIRLAHGDDRSAIAVLQNRSDAIDHHLQYTDTAVQKLVDQVNGISNSLSRMEGEEYAAWGLLSLLMTGNLVVRLKGK